MTRYSTAFQGMYGKMTIRAMLNNLKDDTTIEYILDKEYMSACKERVQEMILW